MNRGKDLFFAPARKNDWDIDSVTLNTVGIDIGTSSTIISIAKINLKRMARDLSSQFTVVSRKQLYGSRITFTPYTSDGTINGEEIKGFIDRFYSECRLKQKDIDTGIVILTGEALLKKNSEAVAKIVSMGRGRFVTIAAGHSMEAALAAYGSGSISFSERTHSSVLNIDIGGGTTKLCTIKDGKIESVNAVRIGGRVIVRDPSGKIERLEESGEAILDETGFTGKQGSRITDAEMKSAGERLADLLISVTMGKETRTEIPDFYLTGIPGNILGSADHIIVSGGVGEHFYDDTTEDFGDLGGYIGSSLREKLAGLNTSIEKPENCIRATVMGLSQYSIQISGSTVYFSQPGALPVLNARSLRVDYDFPDVIDSSDVTSRIREASALYEIDGSYPVAVFFHWKGKPSYSRIRALCEAVVESIKSAFSDENPVILVFDDDIAWIVGDLLTREFSLERDIICVDGVTLGNMEFIDIGEPIYPAGVLPVTVKSLLFH